MKRTFFDIFHPAVPLVYFVVLLVLGMTAMQPICLAILFFASALYNIVLRSARSAIRMLAWLVVLIVAVALLNFFIAPTGSTEVARIGSYALYSESFVFGLCMGLMLASVILVFSNAAQVLSSDKIMALLGNVLPTVGLMTCMVVRLVPSFVREGASIDSSRRACTAAFAGEPACVSAGGGMSGAASASAGKPGDASASAGELYVVPEAEMRRNARGTSKRRSLRDGKIASRARVITVLLGLSMENSLEESDSMRARGWGARTHRTTYARYRFRLIDGYAIALIAVLAAAVAVCTWVICSTFEFYPMISGFVSWPVYIPFVLFVVAPILCEVGERIRWRK